MGKHTMKTCCMCGEKTPREEHVDAWWPDKMGNTETVCASCQELMRTHPEYRPEFRVPPRGECHTPGCTNKTDNYYCNKCQEARAESPDTYDSFVYGAAG